VVLEPAGAEGVKDTTGGLLTILGFGVKGLATSNKTRMEAGTTIRRTNFFTSLEFERIGLGFCSRFFNRFIPGLPLKVFSLIAFFKNTSNPPFASSSLCCSASVLSLKEYLDLIISYFCYISYWLGYGCLFCFSDLRSFN
jgi:hypothetical protein